MNLKLKAVAISLGVIGSGLLAGFVMSQLPYWVAGILVIVFALGLVYNLALASLKFDETVEEMKEKYKD
jgi:hypothetical protein